MLNLSRANICNSNVTVMSAACRIINICNTIVAPGLNRTITSTQVFNSNFKHPSSSKSWEDFIKDILGIIFCVSAHVLLGKQPDYLKTVTTKNLTALYLATNPSGSINSTILLFQCPLRIRKRIFYQQAEQLVSTIDYLPTLVTSM